MLYYLNIPLPLALARKISQVERNWQGSSASAPHLTLIAPKPLLDGVEESRLVAACERVLSDFVQIPIRFGGVGVFSDSGTIYAAVSRLPELVACHDCLAEALDGILGPLTGKFDRMPTPHVSFASRLSGENLTFAEAEARQVPLGCGFTAKRIQLLRKRQGGPRWELVQSFALR